MDFYKKITRSKDVSGVLNEKEYKCVSLQAITNEAVKENNRERLKDLVEEINGHLTDLRLIKDDKDPKNKEKCDKLIYQFENCLVKILNKKPSDNFLTILNEKLEEVQQLSNIAVQENDNEKLKKLVEKIERNLIVVKEMPEVQNANTIENGGYYLKLVEKYEDLLNVINTHVTTKKKVVSEPMSAEVFYQIQQGGNSQEQENPISKTNKIGLNEVEEKLKLMRQKRLNRLSTFVDQQSKLSEQRSRESSPKNSDNFNKSLENLSKMSESLEIETAIKSIRSPEIAKPSSFRAIAREKRAQTAEQKVLPNADEKVIKKPEPKQQPGAFQGETSKAMASFKNISRKNAMSAIVSEKQLTANTVVTVPVREWTTPIQKIGYISKEEDTKIKPKIPINTTDSKETAVPEIIGPNIRSSSGKRTFIKSFAERQIENAKLAAVSEKPKVQQKQPNSTKTTPPRTPTQIRKIFNSINACVLGANSAKSIEDLPKEFNSPFEQELKTVHLKATGSDYRLETLKESKEASIKTHILEIPKIPDNPPPVPKRTQLSSRDKTELERSRVFGQKEFDNFPEKGQIEKKTTSEYYDVNIVNRTQESNTKINRNQRRLSLDFDSVVVREHESNYANQQPTDLVITVKRDSNTVPNETDRYSFSTFRSSTDSLKNFNAYSVENPLYGIIQPDVKPNKNLKDNKNNNNNNTDKRSFENPLYGILQPTDITTISSSKDNKIYDKTVTYSSCDKAFKDLIMNCNALEDLLKTVTRKELRNVGYVEKVKELNALLKDVKNKVEDSLDIDENDKENLKFLRYFEEISKIENTIDSFMGFKRDPDYLLIDKQLAKYYVEIDQIRVQSPNERSEKMDIRERLKLANKNLEDKVTHNEQILKNVLEEQVRMLGEKYKLAV